MKHVPHLNIVGICDKQLSVAQKQAETFSIPFVTDSLDQLFAQKPHVVHVLTPPASHAEVTIQALQHGCHCLVEKPLANSVAECDAIIDAANQAHRTVGIDHSLLLDPFTQKAQRVVQGGKIGRVISVECLRSQDYPPYAGGPLPPYAKEGGYPFRDLGIHAFYQIEAFLGPIEDVQWQFRNLTRQPFLAFDDWRATLQCANGSAHVHLSWNARPLQDLLLIQGTEGSIRIDRFGMSVTTKRQSRLPEHPRRALNAMCEGTFAACQVPINLANVVFGRIRRYHGLQATVAEFYDALRSERSPLATPQDARRLCLWIEKVAGAADQQHQQQLQSQDRPLSAPTLVTGGTGLIGKHLVRTMVEQGRHIRLLVRTEPTDPLFQHPNIEWAFGNLGDPAAVEKAVAGATDIVHVGGVVDGWLEDFQCGNVVGTQNVIDAALRHHVKKLTYVSSMSVIHSIAATPNDVIDETWPLEAHADLRGAYTQTKLAAEQLVTAAVKEHQLPAVILRPAEVIGAGAPALSGGVARKLGKRLIVFGNGKLTVPMIHVQDVVSAILAAHDQAVASGSIYNVIDSRPISQNEYLQHYQAAQGTKAPVHHVPRWLLYALGASVWFGFAYVLRRTSPLSVYRLRSALAPRTFASEKATRELGWQPQHSIADGIQQAVRS
ncbi:MAG: NAD-dependent epimerase/dehydratase family protein [Pirellulaceae bacterium]